MRILYESHLWTLTFRLWAYRRSGRLTFLIEQKTRMIKSNVILKFGTLKWIIKRWESRLKVVDRNSNVHMWGSEIRGGELTSNPRLQLICWSNFNNSHRRLLLLVNFPLIHPVVSLQKCANPTSDTITIYRPSSFVFVEHPKMPHIPWIKRSQGHLQAIHYYPSWWCSHPILGIRNRRQSIVHERVAASRILLH